MQRGFSAATTAAKSLAAGGFGIGAVTGLGRVAKAALDSAEAIGEAAKRVGLTTDAYQKLSFQDKQSGSSVETLTSGLENFLKLLSP